MNSATPAPPRALGSSRLAIIVASRLVLNTIFRVTYPLVPIVAAQYGVSLRAATWLVTVQVLAGLVSPLGGWLSDRQGYRPTMLLGLSISGIGALLAVFATQLAMLLAALTLVGLGTALYQPSMHAYVSELTPLARRGRALGIVELSWSLAGIIGISPILALIAWSGNLAVAFGLLAALILVMLGTSAVYLPDEQQHRTRGSRPSFRRVMAQPHLLALLLFLWLAVCGQEVLFIAQVPWLTEYFLASPQRIGLALFVFGWGELVGVMLVTAFADRIGRLRAPLLGFVGVACVYVLLPVLSLNWPAYLVMFGLFALAFEFAIVSSFALASGVDPTARGTVMAGSTVATATGRAAGSRIGVPVYEMTSLLVNGIVAAGLTLIGVVLAALYVQPREQDVMLSEDEAVRVL
jgi:predicted MFS family arabinose efflux permease